MRGGRGRGGESLSFYFHFYKVKNYNLVNSSRTTRCTSQVNFESCAVTFTVCSELKSFSLALNHQSRVPLTDAVAFSSVQVRWAVEGSEAVEVEVSQEATVAMEGEEVVPVVEEGSSEPEIGSVQTREF